MEAPDKINVPILNGKLFGIIKEDGGRFRDCDGHIEYLRKDTLLEWAREKASFYKQMDEDFGGDVFLGNRHAFMEMIDKINEM